MDTVVDDLEAEQRVLDLLVSGIGPDDWRRPTPAAGWNVADCIAHLAMSEEAAVESLEGRGRDAFAFALADPEAALRRQGELARSRDVLAWWREARAQSLSLLRAAAPRSRVWWGIGEMSVTSLATARLMECWAHGLDVFAGLGVKPVDTSRLRHVCHLGYRTLPYAFEFAAREMPGTFDDLELSLDAPDGSTWTFGPSGAPQRITGSAGEFARLAVRRLARAQATTLRAEGPLADAALDVAKAYLS